MICTIILSRLLLLHHFNSNQTLFMNKISLAAFVCALTLFSHCSKETIGPVTDIGVYINEVQSTGGDWLEIYNGTSSAVNLAGFKIYDDPAAKFSILSGTVPAKGFFILICDGTGVGGNASFKLSSLGEKIYIEDAKGTVIDEVDFPAMTNRSSYARFPDGAKSWEETGDITKNATNGPGHAPIISLLVRTPQVPGLSDVVTVKATVTDVAGITSVTLHTRKDAAAFTSRPMTLSAGVYTATIAAAGTTGTIEYYVEAVNSKTIKSSYPASAPVKAFSYLLNTDPLPQLFINEFMAFNATCCPDVQAGINEFDDWIEIYNAGTAAVNIAGYNLSDSLANPFKFTIPKTNAAQTTIPAGGYLIIWADESTLEGVRHANFQLSQLGEAIGLYYLDGRKIDEYSFGTQTVDKSTGRTTKGDAWLTTPRVPTPGAVNK